MEIAGASEIGPTKQIGLLARVALLSALIFTEKTGLTSLVNTGALWAARSDLVADVRNLQQFGFRFVVAFGLSLTVLVFAYRDKPVWKELGARVSEQPIRSRWLILHVFFLLPLALLSYFLYGRSVEIAPFGIMAALWIIFAAFATFALVLCVAPGAIWWAAARKLGALWLYALIAATLAVGTIRLAQSLWLPAADLTFEWVSAVLRPIIPSLQPSPHSLILYSNRFSVRITPLCSGLEGMGLLLAFCCSWLLCFRHEYSFPRALVLIPIALVVSFLLNVARISILMLIGYCGYQKVAMYGFHSQAGWIAFNWAAGAFAYASRRCSLLLRRVQVTTLHEAVASKGLVESGEETKKEPTAAYLVPFLMTLAMGMIARMLSGGFDTLYVLKPIGAGLALLWGWPILRKLNWNWSWRAPVVGAVAFLVWVIAAQAILPQAGMPVGLSKMSQVAKIIWVVTRVGAATLTVPIAEELAFRGYLMRRIVAPEFQNVRFAVVRLAPLIISSFIFGLEHGVMWLPGMVVGMAYGYLMIRTESTGNAAIAHATTNLLISLDVLLRGQWQLW